MKLIYCKKCRDVYSLTFRVKTCYCGETSGYYVNDIDAEYQGEQAVPIGIDNGSLKVACEKQPEHGLGERFDAFVIPKQAPTMKGPAFRH